VAAVLLIPHLESKNANAPDPNATGEVPAGALDKSAPDSPPEAGDTPREDPRKTRNATGVIAGPPATATTNPVATRAEGLANTDRTEKDERAQAGLAARGNADVQKSEGEGEEAAGDADSARAETREEQGDEVEPAGTEQEASEGESDPRSGPPSPFERGKNNRKKKKGKKN
jgi:hypothetical protein